MPEKVVALVMRKPARLVFSGLDLVENLRAVLITDFTITEAVR